jgi:hypothetical protein
MHQLLLQRLPLAVSDTPIVIMPARMQGNGFYLCRDSVFRQGIESGVGSTICSCNIINTTLFSLKVRLLLCAASHWLFTFWQQR